MTDPVIEAYLAEVTRALRLARPQREDICREMRAHLIEALDAEMAGGAPVEAALQRILEDFGDPQELAASFSSLHTTRRWIMRGTAVAASVLLMFAGLQAWTPQAVFTTQAGSPAQQAKLTMLGTAPNVERSGGAAGDSSAAASDDSAAVRAALRRVLPGIEFEERPLADVLKWMRDELNVNMHVQWSQMEMYAGHEKPITLALKNVTYERLLRLVLSEASGDGELMYRIDDGILMISTREMLPPRVEARVYDVRDLLESVGREVAPGTDVADMLIRLITESVEPESWAANGGHGGISTFGGVLVVRAEGEAHEQLDKLLRDLRATTRATAGGDAPSAPTSR